MAGGPVGAALGVLDDPLFDGAIGDAFASLDPNDYEGARKKRAEADQLQEEAAGFYDDLSTPEALEEYSVPDSLSYVGTHTPATMDYESTYTPETLMGDYNVTGNRFDDIEVDPRYANSQDLALSGVRDIVDSEGLTAADRANLNRIQQDVGRADRGRREAIQDRMRRQGMGGSGLDMLAQLSSNQAATDRANQTGLDIAGMGQQRKENALRDLGSMGTDMRGQAFDEGAQRATAANSIAKFNAEQALSKDRTNMDARNQAAQFKDRLGFDQAQTNYNANNDARMFNMDRNDDQTFQNWTTKNQYRDANTDTRNQNRRNTFQDDMTIRDKKYNAKAGHANYTYDRGRDISNRNAQMTSGLINMATSGAQYALGRGRSDEDEKKDTESLSPEAIAEFLESVKPKKYKYKNQKHGQGERVGFMAQDIENSEIGDAIVQENDEGVKEIDNFNLLGALLDSVSYLHNKQKKLEKK